MSWFGSIPQTKLDESKVDDRAVNASSGAEPSCGEFELELRLS